MSRFESRMCPRVDSPCATPPSFARGQKSAFCSGCQKEVHNFSAITAQEQRSLLSRGGDLCVRYRRLLPIAVVMMANAAGAGDAAQNVETKSSDAMVSVVVTGGLDYTESVFLESEIDESFDEEQR